MTPLLHPLPPPRLKKQVDVCGDEEDDGQVVVLVMMCQSS